MFLVVLVCLVVCLFVCLSVHGITFKLMNGFACNFYQRNNPLNVDDDTMTDCLF